MSGPKSTNYTVSDNSWQTARRASAAVGWAAGRAARMAAEAAARREAARRAEARRRAELAERADTLCGELRKAAGQWQQARGEHGEEFPSWPHGEAPDITGMKDVQALEAAVGDLAERVSGARREYAQQAALFRVRTSLQAASQAQASASSAAASSEKEEEARREERDLRRCAEEVARLLGTLETQVPSRDRTAIENRAREAAEAPRASRRKALLAQLRLDIQRANEAGRERQRMAGQAAKWRERLSGLEGPEVEELDRALRQVVDGEAPLAPEMAQKVEDAVARDEAQRRMVEQAEQWREELLGLEGQEVEELDRALREVVDGKASLPAGMAQTVEDVVARATEASDRAYALGVITEELENLGYVVETGFETAAPGSEMLLHKPGMEEYHVSLQAEAGASVLNTKMVREAGDGGPGRSSARERTDREMEGIWCRDFAAALGAAGRRGVRGRVVNRAEAGDVPVETIAPLKGRSRREGRSRRKRTGRPESRAGRQGS